MIELNSVNASVGTFSLTNVSFKIPSGSCHVIVGPTGSGKTFLLETVIGIRKLTSGNILFNGQDVADLTPNDRHVAYVPQDTCLFPNMTVSQNIRFGLEMRRTVVKNDQLFIDHLIDFLHIGDLLERYPRNLSGGEKQRVALARALATKPALLILDEPFSAIDHSLREEIRRMLKQLLDEFKTTTLIVTHDLDEAYFLGDLISIILNGQLIQSGPREKVYYYPNSLAAAEFLGIKNLFTGQVESISQDQITISAEGFEQSLAIPCRCASKKMVPGQTVRFGIRSEAVYINRLPKSSDSGQINFAALIRKIFVRGRMHTIIAELATPRKMSVEIDIHDIAVQKMNLCEGANIQISIDAKHIFLIPRVG